MLEGSAVEALVMREGSEEDFRLGSLEVCMLVILERLLKILWPLSTA